MYVPRSFELDPAELEDFLDNLGAADLVTPTADGLCSTFMPLLYDATVGEYGVLLGHFALLNDHWKAAPTGESLVIAHGSDSYITPMWYESKREHGRVVPTWNHLTVNIHGELVINRDRDWLLDLVTRLTDKFETPFAEKWTVRDAPEPFIEGQLKAIVGMELRISRIEAKAKYSQNRPSADVAGVVAGLRSVGDYDGAGDVARFNGLL